MTPDLYARICIISYYSWYIPDAECLKQTGVIRTTPVTPLEGF